MGSDVVTVPAWVTPARTQVADLHAVAVAQAARSELARGCLDALDWILDPTGPSQEQVQAEAAATSKLRDDYHRGISDTLAWLCGWLSTPRLDIPRRNPDGTVVTADQLYQEMLEDHPLPPTPEERRDLQNAAARQAARWAALTELG